MSKRQTMNSNKDNIEISEEPEIKKHKTENLNEKEDEIRKKLLVHFINKNSNIKTNEDWANYEAEKFIYLFQKAFAAEYNESNEENLDSEGEIKDVVDLIVFKIRKLIQDESNKERSGPPEIAFEFLKSIDKLYHALFKKMARVRGGLNNLVVRRDLFQNRRFPAQKEIQRKKTADLK